MSKKRKSSNQRSINEDSLFATKQSVGEYWRGVKRGVRKYDRIKGTGAIQKSKTIQGVVVVNPQ